jgi:hypothetical protein
MKIDRFYVESCHDLCAIKNGSIFQTDSISDPRLYIKVAMFNDGSIPRFNKGVCIEDGSITLFEDHHTVNVFVPKFVKDTNESEDEIKTFKDLCSGDAFTLDMREDESQTKYLKLDPPEGKSYDFTGGHNAINLYTGKMVTFDADQQIGEHNFKMEIYYRNN